MARGEPKVSNEAVKETLEWMKTALVDAKSNLTTAWQWMKHAVDKKRRTEDYKIGDEVVLSTTNLRTYCPNLPPKIKARWVGPFRIQNIVSPVAFGLDMPPGWRIHPIFHVSKLKRYIRSEAFLREVKPPPPVLVGIHWSIRLRGFSDIKARVCAIGIWCYGNGIHSPRLPGSLNPSWPML